MLFLNIDYILGIETVRINKKTISFLSTVSVESHLIISVAQNTFLSDVYFV